MVAVLLQTLAIDQDIVEENKHEPPQIWFENLIYESSKYRGSIHETEWHNKILVVIFMRLKRGLCNVLCSNSHLVIP